ncbi:MAG: hypothetical protein J5965_13935 [Aeriscardovia sp.]|nr:hypothetical protein [Aeriscardovia sp.]
MMMKRLQEDRQNALLVRISNRRANILPARAILDTYLDHAKNNKGRFLYCVPYRFNARRVRDTGNIILYSSVSGSAIVANIWDADNDYDPRTWTDENFTVPPQLENKPAKTWIACRNAHAMHINAHEWRLEKAGRNGMKMNLAVSFRKGTLSPYLFIEPDTSGDPYSF